MYSFGKRKLSVVLVCAPQMNTAGLDHDGSNTHTDEDDNPLTQQIDESSDSASGMDDKDSDAAERNYV